MQFMRSYFLEYLPNHIRIKLLLNSIHKSIKFNEIQNYPYFLINDFLP